MADSQIKVESAKLSTGDHAKTYLMFDPSLAPLLSVASSSRTLLTVHTT
jgi:hypothetical protein